MSFLNSVLSSLNDGKTALSVPEVRPTKPLKTESNNTPATTKRKADDELRAPSNTKSAKTLPSRPTPDVKRAISTPAPASASASTSALTPTPKPKAVNALRAEGKDGMSAKGGGQTTNPPGGPPKKGSFAEILARGANNRSGAVIGTITHKAKDKLSTKKELQLQKEMTLKNKKNGIGRNLQGVSGSKTGGPALGKPRFDVKTNEKGAKGVNYQGTSKPKPQSSYTGTMKAKPQSAYKGTMKSGPENAKRKDYESEPERTSTKMPTKARAREHYSDVDTEEDESEDQYDYASEDYSDMDAGFDDVEEEDEKATRLARKEDAAEQRMLDEMKRQKEERKRRALLAQEKEKLMRRG